MWLKNITIIRTGFYQQNYLLHVFQTPKNETKANSSTFTKMTTFSNLNVTMKPKTRLQYRSKQLYTLSDQNNERIKKPKSGAAINQLAKRMYQLTDLLHRDEGRIQIPIYFATLCNNNNCSTIAAGTQEKVANAILLDKDFQFNQALENVYRKYPDPKLKLQSYYKSLSRALNQNDLNVEPQYQEINYNGHVVWKCSYLVKWPNEHVFTNFGVSKKDTSTNAALLALKWLEENNKISLEDSPILECTPTVTANASNENISSVIEELGKLDPFPKNTLHSFYQILSAKMGQNFIVAPEYRVVGNQIHNQWECTYNIKWPMHKIFSDLGSSKQKASTKAALTALQWLRTTQRISYTGLPILHTVKKPKTLLEQFKNMKIDNCFNFNNGRFLSPNNTNMQIRAYSTASRGKKSCKVATTELIEPKPLLPVNLTSAVPKQSSIVSESEESKSLIQSNDLELSSEIAVLDKIYPAPKGAVHTFYDILSRDMGRADLKVVPQYKMMAQKKKNILWMCFYSVKWPEEMKFSHLGFTKQDASHKAALMVLDWLRKNKKISSHGHPLMYDTKEVKQLTRRMKTFELNEYQKSKLNDIVGLHEKYLLPLIKQSRDENENHGNNSITEDEIITRHAFQKFQGKNVYAAKESVVLPIAKFKEEFISYLTNNRVLIIKGEPGCGKSTRIPQYILEGWSREAGLNGEPCRIVVTQPRRIAAISLAERVAKERRENLGSIVGYQIRFKSMFSKHTGRILYCTTGILLRQLQSDPKFSNFTHIVLDEAHERDVNTDLLMNLVRSALEHNPNLKVIVMSATVDTKLFQNYFDGAPLMHIPGFTYPVKVHYLEEAQKLNLAKTIEMSESEHPSVVHEDIVKVINFIHTSRAEGAILCFLPGWDDIMKVLKLIPQSHNLKVLCLHSRLQDSEQHLIFLKPPAGVRKVILATNIAETSVTIDDVVYVIDTGIQKEERLDVEKGVMSIDNHWISQSSMAQRKGRAGRVRAGESFHLYPRWKYDQFLPHSIPEILRTLLTKIVLDTKIYSNNMNAVEFLSKLPCPPNENAVLQAVDELKDLELLDENENLTPLGRTLAEFQLPPKISKTIVNSVIYKCVTPIIDIVTIFSADIALFATGLYDKQFVRKIKNRYSSSSDHLALMRLFEKWLDFREVGENYNAEKLCREAQLVDYKLKTIEKLREVHFGYLKEHLTNVLPIIADDYSDNDELVRGVLLSGVGTLLEHRNWDILKGRLKSSNIFVTRYHQKATITSESVNHKRAKFPSNFLVYINETISNIRRTTIIRETSLISPITVLLFRNKKLTISELPKENYSEQLKSQDQVLLTVDKTKMEFICDREEAAVLVKCKDALLTGMQYYIHQLTVGGKNNPEVDEHWERILEVLNEILAKEDFH